MFPIPPLQDLPQFRPGQALLLLDLQNDFLSEGAPMAVKASAKLQLRIANLATIFRNEGHLIWTKTEFERERSLDNVLKAFDSSSRAVYDGESDSSTSSTENPGPCMNHEISDAFLSKGRLPECCQPNTAGAEFSSLLAPSVDSIRDTILKKSHYSAFENSPLLVNLRSKLINDLFICGLLSNISVYATALDAARHGFAITIVEDCLGYRCQQCHKETLRQLEEICGVEYVSSAALLRQFRKQKLNYEKSAKPPTSMSQALESDLSRALERATLNDEIHEDPRFSAGDEKSDSFESKSEEGYQGSGHTVNREKWETKEIGSGPKRVSCESPSDSIQDPIDDDFGNTHLGCIGEGDSDILEAFLPAALADSAFDRLKSEVQWQKMQHRGGDVPRLVAVQGEIDADGFIPIYRHPADAQPALLSFSPTVALIREEVEKQLGHTLNHVLIQLYRRGQDNISEHSDKTLDISRNSNIVNVSLGAQRTMVLRTKTDNADGQLQKPLSRGSSFPRKIQRVALPHNSMFILGPATNMRWMHGIRPDKREIFLKSAAEQAFGGERISLTFRKISTFTDTSMQVIWGQGARGKTKETAEPVISRGTKESEELIIAFGKENHQSIFDWDMVYGKGYNVLT